MSKLPAARLLQGEDEAVSITAVANPLRWLEPLGHKQAEVRRGGVRKEKSNAYKTDAIPSVARRAENQHREQRAMRRERSIKDAVAQVEPDLVAAVVLAKTRDQRGPKT